MGKVERGCSEGKAIENKVRGEGRHGEAGMKKGKRECACSEGK